MFGTQTIDNITTFGGSYHALVESNDGPNASFTEDGLAEVEHNQSDSVDINGNDDDENEMPGLIHEDQIDVDIDDDNNERIKNVRFADAIDTVAKSRARFSKRDQIRADRARTLQHVAGFPYDETVIYSVSTNRINNNPISRRDVQTCQDMLGKSKHVDQGENTMRSSEPIDVNSQNVELSPTILTHYGSVQLAADIMHVNDVPFLTSISNHLHYGTSKAVDNLKAPTLEDGLKNVIRSYAIRGFSIGMIFLDIQFKSLKDRNVLGVTVCIVSRGEHVKQIERFHRAIEERCR